MKKITLIAMLLVSAIAIAQIETEVLKNPKYLMETIQILVTQMKVMTF